MALMDKIAIIDSHIDRMKVAAKLPNTATLEELTSKVEKGVGGGGGYDGQLPNNSTIINAVVFKDTLRVYLQTDAIASGTRIYYKENGTATLTDEYVDVPVNQEYGIIPNINVNAIYSLRVSSYIEYEPGKLAFNNSNTIGSKIVKLSTQYNKSKAILIDIPLEDQGNTPTQVGYSKYSNSAYVCINSKIYRLNFNNENPYLEQILTDLTLSSTQRMCITDVGVFFRTSSKVLFYDETNNSYVLTNLASDSYVYQLSNGDIIGHANSNLTYLYKFNTTSKTFEYLISSTVKEYNDGPSVIDSDIGIFIPVCLTDESNRFALYKYNFETSQYELLGKFPTDVVLINNQFQLNSIIPIVGSYLVKGYKEIYYLKGEEFISLGLTSSSSMSTELLPKLLYYDNVTGVAQNPNDPSILYVLNYTHYSYHSLILYEIDLNTNTKTIIYENSGSSTTPSSRWVKFIDNILVTSLGYYNTITKEFTALSTRTTRYNAQIFNNKLYRFFTNVEKFNASNNTWDVLYSGMYPNSGYTTTWSVPLGNNKVLLYNAYDTSSNYSTYFTGVYVLDTDTDNVTKISTKPYTNVAVYNNKIYLISKDTSVKNAILDPDTLEIMELNVYGGSPIKSTYTNWESLYGLNVHKQHALYDGISLKGTDDLYTTFYDSTNKTLNSFDELLLDLSGSSKTFTFNYTVYYMYQNLTFGIYGIDANKQELVIVCSATD